MRRIRAVFSPCVEHPPPLDFDLASDEGIALFGKLSGFERPIIEECIRIRQRQNKLLFKDHNAVLAGLSHGTDSFRADCYYLESFYWVSDKQFQETYKLSIEGDPYLPVRELAMRCLTACHFNSLDPETLTYLRRVVTNETESASIRRLAYEGLFLVNWDNVKRFPSETERRLFPESIDWSIVNG